MDLCYRSGRRSVMRFGRWLVAGLKLAADTIDTAMTPSWGRPRSFGFPRVARTLLDFSRRRCGRDPRAHRSTPKPVRGAVTQSSENMDVPLTVADVADPLSSDAVALLKVSAGIAVRRLQSVTMVVGVATSPSARPCRRSIRLLVDPRKSC